jgi:peptide/nickel transport system substrate-binding protein
MEIVEATIEGGYPMTVDPAACYDTTSGELLMNCYETLVFYDGEHLDGYMPQLATEWAIQNITGLPGSHDNETGLDWTFRYTFRIRDGVPFQNASFGNLTPVDVEYCFERGMVLEAGDNPQWMFYEPLLNGASAAYVNQKQVDPAGNLTERVWVGKCIDHEVESNSTHVWFNLAYPGAYAPFMQILSQTWSSIYSRAWANSLGRAAVWPGTWDDYTGWWAYHNPSVPPLDDPTPAVMGTGPFVLANLDRVNEFWDAYRFTGYWRGWGNGPAPNYGVGWPSFGLSKTGGYVDHVIVTWAYDWLTRSTMFSKGELDYCAVPRQYISSVAGQPNIRCIGPLPSLVVDALFYQFDINMTSPYGPIYDYGVIGENGVPRDFFGNSTYGPYIRKAFSHCIDFDSYIQAVFMGEAVQPTTAIVPSLPYYNASIPKYTQDLAKAAECFQMWPSLWETGFTLEITYIMSSIGGRQYLSEMIANNVNSLNPKFHCSALGLIWPDYLRASSAKQLPLYTLGWLADYPDPHNLALPFYRSTGIFAARQAYNNPTMDALIDQGIETPDGPARAAIYSKIQQLAIDDCPSIALDTSIGRHFEQTWVCGWYYNPSYAGDYFANVWKWYYTPHAQLDTVTNATGNLLPYDVNYDGKTNMVDISIAAASFGAVYGPPISSRWMCRCDFNNDRKIDMRDVGRVASSFGKTSTPWTPPH